MLTEAEKRDLEEMVVPLRFAQQSIYALNKRVGWWDDAPTVGEKHRKVPEKIALCHSELSEALEAHRKDLMDDKLPNRFGIEVELADCIIRILDLAQALGLDVAAAIIDKVHYNAEREDHKRENRAKQGGKRY